MCASFGFDFDNDGIMSWEDDYFGQRITEDPIEKKDNVVYDACFDDIYLREGGDDMLHFGDICPSCFIYIISVSLPNYRQSDSHISLRPRRWYVRGAVHKRYFFKYIALTHCYLWLTDSFSCLFLYKIPDVFC